MSHFFRSFFIHRSVLRKFWVLLSLYLSRQISSLPWPKTIRRQLRVFLVPVSKPNLQFLAISTTFMKPGVRMSRVQNLFRPSIISVWFSVHLAPFFVPSISLNYASLVLKYSLICQVFPCQILCLQNVLWRYFNSTSEHVRSCFVFRLLREDAPRSKMLNFLDTRRPKISPQCFTKMLRGLSIIFCTVVMFAVSL